jgi:hypothetical protein
MNRRRRTPLRLMGALGGFSKSLPRSGVIPTSLARVPGRPQKSPVGEFRVSPRYFLCGVSLPGGGTGGVVGVDERVEGASGRPTGFILLAVDQVEQAALIRPPVEPHRSVASFDDPNQASDEVDGVRTVTPLAQPLSICTVIASYTRSPRREGPARTEGGCPGRILRTNLLRASVHSPPCPFLGAARTW